MVTVVRVCKIRISLVMNTLLNVNKDYTLIYSIIPCCCALGPFLLRVYFNNVNCIDILLT